MFNKLIKNHFGQGVMPVVLGLFAFAGIGLTVLFSKANGIISFFGQQKSRYEIHNILKTKLNVRARKLNNIISSGGDPTTDIEFQCTTTNPVEVTDTLDSSVQYTCVEYLISTEKNYVLTAVKSNTSSKISILIKGGQGGFGTLKEWNRYVQTSNPSIDCGVATNCFNEGEILTYTMTATVCPVQSSIRDRLDVFEWECKLNTAGTQASVKTLGIRKGKRLAYLIDSTDINDLKWKPNQLSIDGGSTFITTNSAWHKNTLRSLNPLIGHSASGTTPVTGVTGVDSSGGSVSDYFTLDGDKIVYVLTENLMIPGLNFKTGVALTVASGSKVIHTPQGMSGINYANNCPGRCLVNMSGVQRVSIDGEYNTLGAPYDHYGVHAASSSFINISNGKFVSQSATVKTRRMFHLQGVNFSRFRNLDILDVQARMFLLMYSNNNFISGVNISSDNASDGLEGVYGGVLLYGANTNTFKSININLKSDFGVDLHSGSTDNKFDKLSVKVINGKAIAATNAANNYFHDVTIFQSLQGISPNGGSGTSAHNYFNKVLIKDSGYSAVDSYPIGTLSQFSIIGSQGNAIRATDYNMGPNTMHSAFHNGFIAPNGGVNNHAVMFFKAGSTSNTEMNMTLSQLHFDGWQRGINYQFSKRVKYSGYLRFHNIGIIECSTDANSLDIGLSVSGAQCASASPSSDLNIEHSTSLSTVQFNSNYDLLSGDTLLLNHAKGGGFTANTTFACPIDILNDAIETIQYNNIATVKGGKNGFEVAASNGICDGTELCVQKYLRLASEIMFDSVGDDDGLCEQNEECVYTPNFGYYQGHVDKVLCTGLTASTDFSGVKMYRYQFNGYEPP